MILLFNFLLWRYSSVGMSADAPAVCFLLDCSVSMAGEPLQASEDVIWRGLYELREGTEVSLVVFRRDAEVLVPRTTEYGAVTAALTQLTAGGETDISEGLRAALTSLSGAEGVRSILLLTDGKNGEERIDAATAQELKEGDTALYIVGILGGESESLRELSEETGGKFVTLEEGAEKVLSGVSTRPEAGRKGRFARMLCLETAAAIGVTCLAAGMKKKKRQREMPLPNAGYLKRDEIRKLL